MVEAAQYDDLVISGFVDSYNNLTLKTTFMINWVIQYCPQVQFVLKVDDDVLVNPWTTASVLQDNANASLLGIFLSFKLYNINPFIYRRYLFGS